MTTKGRHIDLYSRIQLSVLDFVSFCAFFERGEKKKHSGASNPLAVDGFQFTFLFSQLSEMLVQNSLDSWMRAQPQRDAGSKRRSCHR